MGIVNDTNFKKYSENTELQEENKNVEVETRNEESQQVGMQKEEDPSDRMVKFTFEVSEGYINERSDMSLLMNSSENAAKILVDYISFRTIKDIVKKGKNEFYISSKDLGDDKDKLKMFNIAMSQLAACVTLIEKK